MMTAEPEFDVCVVWPDAYLQSTTPRSDEQRNTIYRYFCPQGERYPMDSQKVHSRGNWYQFDTHQDAWYFGTWVNPCEFMILCYCEGDITLTVCEDANAYREELTRMMEYYRESGGHGKLDDHDGNHDYKMFKTKDK